MSKINKIFCIGLNKTGTTSYHEAFKILGFNSLHESYICQRKIYKAIMKNMPFLHYLKKYDCFSDYPVFRYYKELDYQYPGSKFILNTRDPEEWVISRLKHDSRWNDCRNLKPNRDLDMKRRKWLLKFFQTTENDIKEYFKDRSDLLVMNVPSGDGWDKLCPFLGKDVPEVQFPKTNTASAFEKK